MNIGAIKTVLERGSRSTSLRCQLLDKARSADGASKQELASFVNVLIVYSQSGLLRDFCPAFSLNLNASLGQKSSVFDFHAKEGFQQSQRPGATLQTSLFDTWP